MRGRAGDDIGGALARVAHGHDGAGDQKPEDIRCGKSGEVQVADIQAVACRSDLEQASTWVRRCPDIYCGALKFSDAGVVDD
jgi:hypothetical protein